MKEQENYLHKGIIGIGAFSKVKLAEHLATKMKVAIKIMDKSYIREHKLDDKIRREIKIMKSFCHPHIIKLFDIEDTKNEIQVIMEYAPKGDLFNLLKEKKRFSENEARYYFQQLISAIDYIHCHKVCHRDLKLENILLDKNEKIKLSDFGLSNRMMDGKFLRTSCGSENYAPPEIIKGLLYSGSSADVWSCGIILFLLLTGFLPFDETCLQVLYRKIKEVEFNIPVFVPHLAADLIKKCLQGNPAERITIDEITDHPWFQQNLPTYLEELLDQSFQLKKGSNFNEDIINDVLNIYKEDSLSSSEIRKLLIDRSKHSKYTVTYEILNHNYLLNNTNSLYMKQNNLKVFNLSKKNNLNLKKEENNIENSKWNLGIKVNGDHEKIFQAMRDILSLMDMKLLNYEGNGVLQFIKNCNEKESGGENGSQMLCIEIRIYKLNETKDEGYVIDLFKMKGNSIEFLDTCNTLNKKLENFKIKSH